MTIEEIRNLKPFETTDLKPLSWREGTMVEYVASGGRLPPRVSPEDFEMASKY